MMRLKDITFNFENCEMITIDGKYIGDFEVSDLTTSISRIACNAIDQIDTANTIAIEIHKNADKKYNPFGLKYYYGTIFKRLMADDIASIQFTLENQYNDIVKSTTYHYYVDWVGGSNYYNEAQKHHLSKDGNLYLLIKNNAQIEDYFNKEEIDDSEYMNFHFNMFDVG